jgi:hypothetical protein
VEKSRRKKGLRNVNVGVNEDMKGKARVNALAMLPKIKALGLMNTDGHNRIRTCDFCRVKTALYR